MQSRDRVWLCSIGPGILPAIIKEYWYDMDSSALGDSQEGEDILDELIFILHVGGDVQEDA